MHIYLLERIQGADYDEYESMVIIADSPTRARKIANQNSGDEGYIWTDTSQVSCTLIDIKNEGVVLTSFRGA